MQVHSFPLKIFCISSRIGIYWSVILFPLYSCILFHCLDVLEFILLVQFDSNSACFHLYFTVTDYSAMTNRANTYVFVHTCEHLQEIPRKGTSGLKGTHFRNICFRNVLSVGTQLFFLFQPLHQATGHFCLFGLSSRKF